MDTDFELVELPELLRRYFWDYDPARLSWEKTRPTILGRLLQTGGWDAVRWLRANAGDDEIRAHLLRTRGRGLDPKRLRYWELVLDLPKEQVDAWVATARANPWYQRTRRGSPTTTADD